jgi:hypothetical protein
MERFANLFPVDIVQFINVYILLQNWSDEQK